jgi:CheY-like chemotaxis protein
MKTLTKILYVEDEPDIQAVAKVALEVVGGFNVCICSSGAEAITRVLDFQPDLILLDVMMPNMDGPATLNALKALPGLDPLPYVFMTAKVQASEVEHFKSLGALDVIAKPFDPMTLSERVNGIWQTWSQQNGSC